MSVEEIDLGMAPPPPTAMDNLAGDADLDPANGFIEVDHSVPSHPVLRFRIDRLRATGGGGEGEDEPSTPAEDEPGADPEEPYVDPEDTFDNDLEAINGGGNAISADAGSLDDGSGDFCNSIFDGAPDEPEPGNEISSTCS